MPRADAFSVAYYAAAMIFAALRDGADADAVIFQIFSFLMPYFLLLPIAALRARRHLLPLFHGDSFTALLARLSKSHFRACFCFFATPRCCRTSCHAERFSACLSTLPSYAVRHAMPLFFAIMPCRLLRDAA